MSFTSVAAVLGLASLLNVQILDASSQTEAPKPGFPVSLTRIREAIERPESRLIVPPPQSNFRVDINETERFEDLLLLLGLDGGSPMPSVLFGSARSHPSSAVDLSAIGQSVRKTIAQARRARAERLAHEEVRGAFAAFCTTHDCSTR